MTQIAPHITAFLRERLPVHQGASPHTCDAYACTFKLLFEFAGRRIGRRPSELELESIDAQLVLDFLDHLEVERGNRPTTRNARLAAIKSFFRFLEYRVPSLLDQCRRILAVPSKRTDTRLVGHLTIQEMQVLLEMPDSSTWPGLRDRAMLHLAFSAGLRVSELVNLKRDDLLLYPRPAVRIQGKGRRERCLPLWKETRADLQEWLAARGEIAGVAEVFVNRRGRPLTRSGFAYVLDKHVRIASEACPSIRGKRVTPHVLRHTCALMVLQATHDLRKVSLWLGHSDMQTTEIYLRADPTERLETLEAVLPPELRPGRFRPPDRLIALLTKA